MTTHKLPIALAITLTLTNFTIYPALGLTHTSFLVSQNPPDPPPTPPDNKTTSGGSLSGSNAFCQNSNKRLIALIPIKNPVLTTSEYPTIWFYVPQTSEEIREGEFLLQTPDGNDYHYKTRFKLPKTPGFVSISLPSLPKYALEEGKLYRWFLNLYCQGNTSSEADLDVNGWVKRVAKTPEREGQIKAAISDIWYDSLNNLASRRLASPQDEKLKNDWANLLKSIGSEQLAQEKLIGPVQLIEK